MKNLLLLLACFVAVTAHAQIAVAPEAGLNMANMRIAYATNYPRGGVISTSLRPGIAVGAIVEHRIIGSFHLQPGLFYLSNGCNVTGGGYVSVSTIQLPINIQFRRASGRGQHFFVGLGPYIAYNIACREKVGSAAAEKVPIGTDTSSYLKPLDIGIGINAGVLFGPLYIRVHGRSGFANLQPHGDANNFIRTSSLGITVGYYVYHSGKKAKK